MLPITFQGLCNQAIALQELLSIASTLNATLCWPRVLINGLSSLRTDIELNNRPFETLWDREWFQQRVLQVFGVNMVTKRADQELCDFAYSFHVCVWEMDDAYFDHLFAFRCSFCLCPVTTNRSVFPTPLSLPSLPVYVMYL
jgi:hypothetical protein